MTVMRAKGMAERTWVGAPPCHAVAFAKADVRAVVLGEKCAADVGGPSVCSANLAVGRTCVFVLIILGEGGCSANVPMCQWKKHYLVPLLPHQICQPIAREVPFKCSHSIKIQIFQIHKKSVAIRNLSIIL